MHSAGKQGVACLYISSLRGGVIKNRLDPVLHARRLGEYLIELESRNICWNRSLIVVGTKVTIT